MSDSALSNPTSLWERYEMALERVENVRRRITEALGNAGVPYALVGGQAVALWVATKDPAAVRTTKDVDILLRREDLPRAWSAARSAGFDYFEVLGVGMFLEKDDPNPRRAVHIIWAGEKVKAEYPLPSPGVDDSLMIQPGGSVVSLDALIRMKLMAHRDQDRLHLRDMIGVGLIGRETLQRIPGELVGRLDALLTEMGS